MRSRSLAVVVGLFIVVAVQARDLSLAVAKPESVGFSSERRHDRRNDVLFIGMIQRRGTPPGTPFIEDLARQLTYQALVDPSK